MKTVTGPVQIYSDYWPYDSEARMIADVDGTLEPTPTEAVRLAAAEAALDASYVSLTLRGPKDSAAN